ncbi:chromate transporter [Saccharospirillum sp. HFRX-1]|uniref:chromate transporter n=1 Tax=unclassified Saccharospirillum TaxID=2633430 RepID=UPI00371B7003
MIYLQLFVAFFIPNIIGYGGGPAIIPLIEAEVVGRYGWMASSEFAQTLAIGNALPSPIATKMAGQIGYEVAGVGGSIVALLATIAPSLLLMIAALGLMVRFKDSHQVKRMSAWVRPVITLLMALLTVSFFQEGLMSIGLVQTVAIAAVAALALMVLKLHPALVVAASLVYGAIWLA